jgi:hypothetical protein
MVNNDVKTKIVPTYTAEVCVAGDLPTARAACRKFCNDVGACVTIVPADFAYTGGLESGVICRLVNYPRFPSDNKGIRDKAIVLAERLIEALYQTSALVLCSDSTIWIHRRDEEHA